MEVLVLEQLKEVNTKLRNKMGKEKIKKQDEEKSEEKNTADAELKGSLNKETENTGIKDELLKDKKFEPQVRTETKIGTQSETKSEEKEDEKKQEDKKKETLPVVKKTEAIIRSRNLPISTKYSAAICKFIKGKTIEKAERDLEQVIVQKIAVPMKGEIPHRRTAQVGNKKMAGRFPKNASQHFIRLLRNLGANANVNGLENPIISEAVANIGERPFGRFGSTRKKRTHIFIKVKEKLEIKKTEKNKQEEKK